MKRATFTFTIRSKSASRKAPVYYIFVLLSALVSLLFQWRNDVPAAKLHLWGAGAFSFASSASWSASSFTRAVHTHTLKSETLPLFPLRGFLRSRAWLAEQKTKHEKRSQRLCMIILSLSPRARGKRSSRVREMGRKVGQLESLWKLHSFNFQGTSGESSSHQNSNGSHGNKTLSDGKHW